LLNSPAEVLLLLPQVLLGLRDLILVALYFFIMISQDVLVEVLLVLNLLLVSLKGLLESGATKRSVLLQYSWVLVWTYIATLIEWLDEGRGDRLVLGKSIRSEFNHAFALCLEARGGHTGAILFAWFARLYHSL